MADLFDGPEDRVWTTDRHRVTHEAENPPVVHGFNGDTREFAMNKWDYRVVQSGDRTEYFMAFNKPTLRSDDGVLIECNQPDELVIIGGART